ncbi:hypothetical protein CIL05_17060 [Virgibacillus profundi]|uniref:Uncharacterized protein n=1 Tax=Virgibacillus profundi TaxID=2024555 RepID=A0A2A2IAN2_9BACI|nr:hypothetical protein CIL05_17060 [Virgibacillus profundi]PXY52294.1 hypothetical protein CIT14_18715 [Virgibacillus profundi]
MKINRFIGSSYFFISDLIIHLMLLFLLFEAPAVTNKPLQGSVDQQDVLKWLEINRNDIIKVWNRCNTEGVSLIKFPLYTRRC